MRGTIIVETQEEYNKWLAGQQSYYAANNPAAAPAAPEAAPAVDSVKKLSMK
jgi:cytochrome c oxidase subunit 2